MTFIYLDLSNWSELFLAGFFMAIGAFAALLLFILIEDAISKILGRR